MGEPGRRRGSCGRETRDRGAGFPLGTPPGLRHRLYPKRIPPPSPPAPRTAAAAARRLLPPQLRFEAASPPWPPAPPAAPGSGKRGRRRAGPGAGRSPRGCFPPPPQPPPPLTPGTRPGPRGRHRVTQPGPGPGGGAARGGGLRRARRAGGEATASGGPGHPATLRQVPPDTLPPRLLSGPESVTGIGFQHGGQEAAPRGGENIPAAPALGGAGPGRRPRRSRRGRLRGLAPQKGV